ncbi:gliding motility-associated C-terminal domain-containing protein [Subsaximicrobium wynnwilliamsii]|uniref:gliding motility-associated C-terminal domain-containing protein n=1 Tax=Subsaximicrobium wynnwilliamsii TaxID=291179 RepID=UPI001674F050|nr:gliding motility-associated C-terminal domain-containing protein [Subsaximicrobium wynnwilliamsii]
MKKLYRSFWLLLLLMSFKTFAQAPTSFPCDGTLFYQTIQLDSSIAGVGSAGDFVLYTVNPDNGAFTFFSNLSVDDDGAGTGDVALIGTINGLGFNTIDGLLYGIDSTLDYLYRITPNGFVENLGIISGPISASNNYSGTFDNNGIYYVLGNNQKLVSIDLSSEVNAGDPLVSTLVYDVGKRSPDIAINPTNFKMYGWDGARRQLFSVDLNNGDVNVIGPAANTSNYDTFGALYFTAGGQLFGYGNDVTVGGSGNTQESVVQFNLSTGIPTTIGLGISVTANDGASCPFGFELFKDAPAAVDLGQVFTYTFTISNATSDLLQNLEFVDNLMSGIVFASDPYNQTNGLSTVGSTNGQTSANLIINNIPVGSSTFQIDVITDCSVQNMVISNQATLASEFLTVVSDDPQTSGITNTTITNIEDPTINVPDPLQIEGCDISVLNAASAVFPLNTTSASSDIKDIFNTVADYTTTASQNITSITYIDTIVDEEACPIVVNRAFSLTSTCGTVSIITQVINVIDTVDPIFQESLPADLTFECSDEIPVAETLTATDNCSQATVAYSETIIQGDCPSQQTIERTWTATDECANTLVHTQTISIDDTTAPVAPEAPADITIEESDPNNVPAVTLTAVDNCSGEIDATSVDTVDDSDPNNIFIVRTWTFVDDCDNNSSISQTITLFNNPSFTCDGTVFYQTIKINQDIENVGSAGDFILYLVNPSGDFSFFANLSVDDDGAGTADEALVGSINAIGFNTLDGLIYGVDSTNDYLYRILPNGFVQNLGIVSGPISNTSNYAGTFDNNGTYYILGNNGHIVSIEGTEDIHPGDPIVSTFLYDLNLNSADVAISPSDLKMYGWKSSTRQLFRVDLSTGNIEIIGPDANTSNYFSFGGLYFTASGQLFGYGNDTNVGSPGNSQESVVQFNLSTGEPTTIGIGVEVTENDGASCAFGFELLKEAPDTVDLGQTFTYTFTIANATNDILNDLEFIDNLVPGLVFTSDPYNITNGMTITGSTNGLTSANLDISAIPTGSSTFQIDVITDCSITDMVISNQATLSSEFLTVTSDDPDTAGVTNTTLTQIIDPTISVPNPLTIEGCDISVVNVETAVFPLSTTMSDDIKDVFNTLEDYTTTAPQNITSITYIDTVVDEDSCPIIINRVFTLTNTCDVSTTYTQVINVQDSTAPVTPEAPEDLVFECNDDLPMSMDLTAVDNCSGEITVSPVMTTDDTNPCNVIMTFTWNFTDECGNTSSISQIVRVTDETAPVAPEVPADMTYECIDDIPEGVELSTLDYCAGELTTLPVDTIDDSDACNVVVTRTWTFTDACENTTAVSQTITVIDTTGPTFTVPNDIAIDCDQDPTDITLTGGVADAVDNCAANALETSYSDSITDGTCENSSIVSRSWTVTDPCGNATILVQTITVQDATAPSFTVPADITFECDTDVTDLSITGDVTDEADNCATGLDATYTDETSNNDSCTSTIIRTWTLTDACENTTTQVQTITLQDDTAPSFTVPADITFECDADVTDLSVTGDVTDEADNCATGLDATYTDETSNNGSCASTIIRTWTLTDDCENTTTQVQTITLQDDTAPSFTVPADITIECDEDATDVSITGNVTDATDNCDTELEATFTDDVVAGECDNSSVITRTWTVADACDNSTTLVQTITVQDSTAPTLVGDYEANVVLACGEDTPEIPELEFVDACSETVNVDFTENTEDEAAIVRQWIVSDACGNEAIFIQTISINEQGEITVDNSTDLCIEDDFDTDLFDLLSGDFDTNGTWTEASGNAVIDGSFFNPTSLLDASGDYPDSAIRDYVFTYTTTGNCALTVDVTVAINDECVVAPALPCDRDNVVISKAVTANGDNINDEFSITGVETCGFTYELQIFNRWGAKIYENFNYQNDWNGTASSKSIGSSGFVPTGTYYYILNIKNSGFEPIAGPIYVSTK